MNNLLYARLAKTNLSKNRQIILPYLLSCIGSVVMFFIMDTLAQGSGFDSMIGKDTILTVMGMGTYIIGLFAVIFLIYSNSFLAKRRKKEFGLFQILGMEKKHLAKILFFESLYLWAASLGIGILLGEGKCYSEAMDILAGVTLESLVVARRVAKAIYRKAELGQVSLQEFPMLVHANDVLDNGKDAELPWEKFTFDHTAN